MHSVDQPRDINGITLASPVRASVCLYSSGVLSNFTPPLWSGLVPSLMVYGTPLPLLGIRARGSMSDNKGLRTGSML